MRSEAEQQQRGSPRNALSACARSQAARGPANHGSRLRAVLLRGCAGLALLVAWAAAPARAAPGAPWILIDTPSLSLSIYSPHNRLIARLRNIAIGSGGAADLHLRGDDTTPRGTYRIAWIDRHSRFGQFFGLDYPTPRIAARAYLEGRIARPSFEAILRAARERRLPPQDTALGGDLGIHGVGGGAPAIQRAVNWTDGCVALGSAQLRELERWARVGTTVVIR